MMQNQPPAADKDTLTTTGEKESGQKIRLRAIVLGSVFALLICLITPFNNAYRQATPLGGGHFPLAPFYILVWLMIITAFARMLFRGRKIISGKELLVSWALMVLLSGVAWTGLARTFFINLTAPFHFATIENRWSEVLHPLLPSSWYPQSSSVGLGWTNGTPCRATAASARSALPATVAAPAIGFSRRQTASQDLTTCAQATSCSSNTSTSQCASCPACCAKIGRRRRSCAGTQLRTQREPKPSPRQVRTIPAHVAAGSGSSSVTAAEEHRLPPTSTGAHRNT